MVLNITIMQADDTQVHVTLKRGDSKDEAVHGNEAYLGDISTMIENNLLILALSEMILSKWRNRLMIFVNRAITIYAA